MNKKNELLLHHVAAKYIMSEDVDIELKGQPAEMSCLKNLLEISKNLKESLDNDDSYDVIIEILKQKKEATQKFENLTGIPWRL